MQVQRSYLPSIRKNYGDRGSTVVNSERRWFDPAVGSITCGWLRFWIIYSRPGNPPYPNVVPATMAYLRTYITDTAYVPGQRRSVSTKAYKARIYTTLRALSKAMTPPQGIRIEKLWPHADWKVIWKNLAETPTSEADIEVWYKVINDIIPTNERLHRIKMASTDTCKECGEVDTPSQTITECGESKAIWDWTQQIIARMLRTSPSNITQDWLLRPQFCLWSPQRQRAVMWLLSRHVIYRSSRHQSSSSQDYLDFLRRSRWKMNQQSSKPKLVANFLSVVDTHY